MPAEEALKPCVKHIYKSATLQECHVRGWLQFVERPGHQLEIYCGNHSQPSHGNCGTTPGASRNGYLYYFSTKVVRVQNIYHERICGIGMEEKVFTDDKTHFLYLTAHVCHPNGTVITKVSGTTTTRTFHKRIDYPILYNPGILAEKHPKPYWISSVGLYLDDESRLSLNLLTSKPFQT